MLKKTIYYVVLSLMLLGYSCDNYDNIIPAQFDVILSIKQVGEQNITLYETGEGDTYSITLLKGGTKPESAAKAKVRVLSSSELGSYSEMVGRKYTVLPKTLYEIPDTIVDFASKEQYLNRKILFKTTDIRELLEANSEVDYVLPISLVSSTDSVNSNRDLVLIRPQKILQAMVGFEVPSGSIKLDNESNEYSINIISNYNNPWEIIVGLVVDEQMIDQYNIVNETNYPVLPADAYTINPMSVIIPGQNAIGKTTIVFHKKKIDYKDYILPIVLKNTSKLRLDENNKTHFILVSNLADRLNATEWKVIDFSSEEKIGEGVGQGLAANIINGDPASYWQTQWKNGTGQMPHHVTIDMQKEFLITSIDIQHRPNQRDTRAGNFYISSDNQIFTKIGSFRMADNNNAQSFSVIPGRGRYVKIEITESRRPPYANLGEVYVRGIE
jgi:hypothetical protein